MSSAITQPADQTSTDGRKESARGKVRRAERRRTDVGGVVGRTEDKLRSAVVPRADVRDVGLSGDEDLRRSEVAKLENTGGRVEEEVLGLDVAVADTDGVDVGERAEEL
jgi:hypothetical protein